MSTGVKLLARTGVTKKQLDDALVNKLEMSDLGTTQWNPVAMGINFGGFSVVDGELLVSHLSTTTPSIVDGELHFEYETF